MSPLFLLFSCIVTKGISTEFLVPASRYLMTESFVFDDTEYIFCSHQVTWDEALVICPSYKAQLVTLDTEPKANFVVQAIAESSLGGAALYGHYSVTCGAQDFWIGARLDSSGAWIWASNKKPLHPDAGDFINIPPWYTDTSPMGKDCLTIDRKNHEIPLFVPLHCKHQRPFICQKDDDSEYGQPAQMIATVLVGPEEFALFSARATWSEAVAHCRKEKLRIAEVRNVAEAQALAMTMLRTRPEGIENAWIGGYTKDGSWHWLATGDEIVNNDLWRNNSRKSTGCLMLDRHLCEVPVYIEARCNRKRDIICQRPLKRRINKRPVAVTVDGCQYWVGFYPLKWSAARQSCNKLNASLVVLDSQRIIDHMMILMINNKTELRHVWTDGHRRGGILLVNGEAPQGNWFWESTGQRIPDNGEGFMPWCDDTRYVKNTDCLNLDRENHDTPIVYGLGCNHSQTYVCQPLNGSCVSSQYLSKLKLNGISWTDETEVQLVTQERSSRMVDSSFAQEIRPKTTKNYVPFIDENLHDRNSFQTTQPISASTPVHSKRRTTPRVRLPSDTLEETSKYSTVRIGIVDRDFSSTHSSLPISTMASNDEARVYEAMDESAIDEPSEITATSEIIDYENIGYDESFFASLDTILVSNEEKYKINYPTEIPIASEYDKDEYNVIKVDTTPKMKHTKFHHNGYTFPELTLPALPHFGIKLVSAQSFTTLGNAQEKLTELFRGTTAYSTSPFSPGSSSEFPRSTTPTPQVGSSLKNDDSYSITPRSSKHSSIRDSDSMNGSTQNIGVTRSMLSKTTTLTSVSDIDNLRIHGSSTSTMKSIRTTEFKIDAGNATLSIVSTQPTTSVQNVLGVLNNTGSTKGLRHRKKWTTISNFRTTTKEVLTTIPIELQTVSPSLSHATRDDKSRNHESLLRKNDLHGVEAATISTTVIDRIISTTPSRNDRKTESPYNATLMMVPTTKTDSDGASTSFTLPMTVTIPAPPTPQTTVQTHSLQTDGSTTTTATTEGLPSTTAVISPVMASTQITSLGTTKKTSQKATRSLTTTKITGIENSTSVTTSVPASSTKKHKKKIKLQTTSAASTVTTEEVTVPSLVTTQKSSDGKEAPSKKRKMKIPRNNTGLLLTSTSIPVVLVNVNDTPRESPTKIDSDGKTRGSGYRKTTNSFSIDFDDIIDEKNPAQVTDGGIIAANSPQPDGDDDVAYYTDDTEKEDVLFNRPINHNEAQKDSSAYIVEYYDDYVTTEIARVTNELTHIISTSPVTTTKKSRPTQKLPSVPSTTKNFDDSEQSFFDYPDVVGSNDWPPSIRKTTSGPIEQVEYEDLFYDMTKDKKTNDNTFTKSTPYLEDKFVEDDGRKNFEWPFDANRKQNAETNLEDDPEMNRRIENKVQSGYVKEDKAKIVTRKVLPKKTSKEVEYDGRGTKPNFDAILRRGESLSDKLGDSVITLRPYLGNYGLMNTLPNDAVLKQILQIPSTTRPGIVSGHNMIGGNFITLPPYFAIPEDNPIQDNLRKSLPLKSAQANGSPLQADPGQRRMNFYPKQANPEIFPGPSNYGNGNNKLLNQGNTGQRGQSKPVFRPNVNRLQIQRDETRGTIKSYTNQANLAPKPSQYYQSVDNSGMRQSNHGESPIAEHSGQNNQIVYSPPPANPDLESVVYIPEGRKQANKPPPLVNPGKVQANYAPQQRNMANGYPPKSDCPQCEGNQADPHNPWAGAESNHGNFFSHLVDNSANALASNVQRPTNPPLVARLGQIKVNSFPVETNKVNMNHTQINLSAGKGGRGDGSKLHSQPSNVQSPIFRTNGLINAPPVPHLYQPPLVQSHQDNKYPCQTASPKAKNMVQCQGVNQANLAPEKRVVLIQERSKVQLPSGPGNKDENFGYSYHTHNESERPCSDSKLNGYTDTKVSARMDNANVDPNDDHLLTKDPQDIAQLRMWNPLYGYGLQENYYGYNWPYFVGHVLSPVNDPPDRYNAYQNTPSQAVNVKSKSGTRELERAPEPVQSSNRGPVTSKGTLPLRGVFVPDLPMYAPSDNQVEKILERDYRYHRWDQLFENSVTPAPNLPPGQNINSQLSKTPSVEGDGRGWVSPESMVGGIPRMDADRYFAQNRTIRPIYNDYVQGRNLTPATNTDRRPTLRPDVSPVGTDNVGGRVQYVSEVDPHGRDPQVVQMRNNTVNIDDTMDNKKKLPNVRYLIVNPKIFGKDMEPHKEQPPIDNHKMVSLTTNTPDLHQYINFPRIPNEVNRQSIQDLSFNEPQSSLVGGITQSRVDRIEDHIEITSQIPKVEGFDQKYDWSMGNKNKFVHSHSIPSANPNEIHLPAMQSPTLEKVNDLASVVPPAQNNQMYGIFQRTTEHENNPHGNDQHFIKENRNKTVVTFNDSSVDMNHQDTKQNVENSIGINSEKNESTTASLGYFAPPGMNNFTEDYFYKVLDNLSADGKPMTGLTKKRYLVYLALRYLINITEADLKRNAKNIASGKAESGEISLVEKVLNDLPIGNPNQYVKMNEPNNKTEEVTTVRSFYYPTEPQITYEAHSKPEYVPNDDQGRVLKLRVNVDTFGTIETTAGSLYRREHEATTSHPRNGDAVKLTPLYANKTDHDRSSNEIIDFSYNSTDNESIVKGSIPANIMNYLDGLYRQNLFVNTHANRESNGKNSSALNSNEHGQFLNTPEKQQKSLASLIRNTELTYESDENSLAEDESNVPMENRYYQNEYLLGERGINNARRNADQVKESSEAYPNARRNSPSFNPAYAATARSDDMDFKQRLQHLLFLRGVRVQSAVNNEELHHHQVVRSKITDNNDKLVNGTKHYTSSKEDNNNVATVEKLRSTSTKLYTDHPDEVTNFSTFATANGDEGHPGDIQFSSYANTGDRQRVTDSRTSEFTENLESTTMIAASTHTETSANHTNATCIYQAEHDFVLTSDHKPTTDVQCNSTTTANDFATEETTHRPYVPNKEYGSYLARADRNFVGSPDTNRNPPKNVLDVRQGSNFEDNMTGNKFESDNVEDHEDDHYTYFNSRKPTGNNRYVNLSTFDHKDKSMNELDVVPVNSRYLDNTDAFVSPDEATLSVKWEEKKTSHSVGMETDTGTSAIALDKPTLGKVKRKRSAAEEDDFFNDIPNAQSKSRRIADMNRKERKGTFSHKRRLGEDSMYGLTKVFSTSPKIIPITPYSSNSSNCTRVTVTPNILTLELSTVGQSVSPNTTETVTNSTGDLINNSETKFISSNDRMIERMLTVADKLDPIKNYAEAATTDSYSNLQRTSNFGAMPDNVSYFYSNLQRTSNFEGKPDNVSYSYSNLQQTSNFESTPDNVSYSYSNLQQTSNFEPKPDNVSYQFSENDSSEIPRIVKEGSPNKFSTNVPVSEVSMSREKYEEVESSLLSENDRFRTYIMQSDNVTLSPLKIESSLPAVRSFNSDQPAFRERLRTAENRNRETSGSDWNQQETYRYGTVTLGGVDTRRGSTLTERRTNYSSRMQSFDNAGSGFVDEPVGIERFKADELNTSRTDSPYDLLPEGTIDKYARKTVGKGNENTRAPKKIALNIEFDSKSDEDVSKDESPVMSQNKDSKGEPRGRFIVTLSLNGKKMHSPSKYAEKINSKEVDLIYTDDLPELRRTARNRKFVRSIPKLQDLESLNPVNALAEAYETSSHSRSYSTNFDYKKQTPQSIPSNFNMKRSDPSYGESEAGHDLKRPKRFPERKANNRWQLVKPEGSTWSTDTRHLDPMQRTSKDTRGFATISKIDKRIGVNYSFAIINMTESIDQQRSPTPDIVRRFSTTTDYVPDKIKRNDDSKKYYLSKRTKLYPAEQRDIQAIIKNNRTKSPFEDLQRNWMRRYFFMKVAVPKNITVPY